MRCLSACFEALLDIGETSIFLSTTVAATGFLTPERLSVAEFLAPRPIDVAGWRCRFVVFDSALAVFLFVDTGIGDFL